MGRALAAVSPEAEAVFRQADEALGRPLSKLIAEGPSEELTFTWNTQPAILTVSVACLAALRARVNLAPVAVAGHSLGEYTALVAAGAMDFADAVRIVEKRGRFMQEAVPLGVGTMYAVLGLDVGVLESICREVSKPGNLVAVANDNCPGQTVISGHVAAVAEAAEKAKSAGAKRAVELQVSAPFHCALMEPAAERLSKELEGVTFAAPSVPVVANVDGEPNMNPSRIALLLRRQVSSPVLWQACVRKLAGLDAKTVVEIGPGKVLSGLAKRIDSTLGVVNVEDPATLEAFVGGLG
jgi:[acyl-carrier-protein] S-malonyltransferase